MRTIAAGLLMMQTVSNPDTRLQISPGTRLALWRADDPALQATAAILVDWFGLTLLDALPTPDPQDGALLLLCQAPAEFICQALGEDRLPATALEDWQTLARPVLALNRANRGRVHLVDAGALCRDPVAFLRHFDLPEKEGAITALSAQAGSAPDPILQMLAQQSLHTDLASRVMVSEIDAVLVRLAAPEGVDEPVGLLAQAYRKRHDEQRELDLLRSQQQGMYEQMEALYSEKLQTEQRLEQLNNGLESYQSQVAALKAEQRGLQQKSADLRGRVATKEQVLQEAGRLLQEAAHEKALLEQAGTVLREKLSSLEQTCDDQAGRIGALESENQRILNSRSHKLMAPLRSLRAALRGGGR